MLRDLINLSFFFALLISLFHGKNDFGNELNGLVQWQCLSQPMKNRTCAVAPRKFRYAVERPDPLDLGQFFQQFCTPYKLLLRRRLFLSWCIFVDVRDHLTRLSWKHMAELTLLDYSTNEYEYFSNALPCFLSCLQPFTTIWIDSTAFSRFEESILPQISVPVVVLLGDRDATQPQFDLTNQTLIHFFRQKIKHFYVHNCHENSKLHSDWITCIPIGMSQVSDSRQAKLVHKHFLTRYGHSNIVNLTWFSIENYQVLDDIQREKNRLNSVLVSFNIANNRLQRQAAWLHFCGHQKTSLPPAILPLELRNITQFGPKYAKFAQFPGSSSVKVTCQEIIKEEYFHGNLSVHR